MGFQEYSSLRAFEADFDRSQGTIRSTASLWILATFAAFSYAVAATLPTDITRAFLGASIAWASSFGLFILWVSDQLVYQKLLHSVFLHGLFMEWRNPQLPQLRTKAYADNLNVSFKLSLFYIAPILGFLVVEIFFAVGTDKFVVPFSGAVASHRVLWAMLGSHIACIAYMGWATLRDGNLLKQHGAEYPTEFRAYLRNGEYEAELRRRFSQP